MNTTIRTQLCFSPQSTRVSDFPVGTFLRQKLDHSFVVLVAGDPYNKQGVILATGAYRDAKSFYSEYEPVSRVEIDVAA